VPVLQVGTTDEIVTISQKASEPPAVVKRKRQEKFLTGIMMDTMKKE
jgi:hypothetical protein